MASTLASALAWSGVGLIAFVPLVGLAVFPLQLAALLLRGIVFEFIGLAALGAYAALYHRHLDKRERPSGRRSLKSEVSGEVAKSGCDFEITVGTVSSGSTSQLQARIQTVLVRLGHARPE